MSSNTFIPSNETFIPEDVYIDGNTIYVKKDVTISSSSMKNLTIKSNNGTVRIDALADLKNVNLECVNAIFEGNFHGVAMVKNDVRIEASAIMSGTLELGGKLDRAVDAETDDLNTKLLSSKRLAQLESKNAQSNDRLIING